MENKFYCNSCQKPKPIEEKQLYQGKRYVCDSCRDKIRKAKKQIVLSQTE